MEIYIFNTSYMQIQETYMKKCFLITVITFISSDVQSQDPFLCGWF